MADLTPEQKLYKEHVHAKATVEHPVERSKGIGSLLTAAPGPDEHSVSAALDHAQQFLKLEDGKVTGLTGSNSRAIKDLLEKRKDGKLTEAQTTRLKSLLDNEKTFLPKAERTVRTLESAEEALTVKLNAFNELAEKRIDGLKSLHEFVGNEEALKSHIKEHFGLTGIPDSGDITVNVLGEERVIGSVVDGKITLAEKNHIDGHVDAATTTAKKVGELHDAHITEIKTQAAEARAQITEATTHFNSGAEHLKQEKLNFSPAAGNSGSKFVTVSENAFKEKKFWDATKTRMSANYEKSNLLEKGVRGTGALIGSYIGFKNGLAIFSPTHDDGTGQQVEDTMGDKGWKALKATTGASILAASLLAGGKARAIH